MVSLVPVRIVISIVVLCVVAIISGVLWVTSSADFEKKQTYFPAEFVKMGQYTSEEHNFIISYPLPHEVIEHSPDAYAVATLSGQTVLPTAVIRVLKNSEGVAFEKYALQQAINICESGTQEYSIVCTDTQNVRPSMTDSGIQGIELYLQEEYMDSVTNKSIQKTTKGPFFAYPLTQQEIILIYPPISQQPAEINRSAVHIIAETLKISQ
ncbi:MAG TPA: hypothetical protein PLD54_01580 [Candidatus Levybacteria bacterium]|nr:hypothetical protein [Candidatus Levybacteria bacterium]